MSLNYNPIILALDGLDLSQLEQMIRDTQNHVGIYKFGLGFFCAYGPNAILKLKETYDIKVFLDLKLYDIPHQVAKAVEALNILEPEMLTIHLSGGRKMIEAAIQANRKIKKILGVSILTSFNQSDLVELGYNIPIDKQVLNLVKQGINSGLNGFVCSSFEIEILRQNYGSNIELIVPGIRLNNDNIHNDDQQRIMSPKEALDFGCNYLVIGRPITEAHNPAALAKEIFESLK